VSVLHLSFIDSRLENLRKKRTNQPCIISTEESVKCQYGKANRHVKRNSLYIVFCLFYFTQTGCSYFRLQISFLKAGVVKKNRFVLAKATRVSVLSRIKPESTDNITRVLTLPLILILLTLFTWRETRLASDC
jgi:hypothetical protein